ncbi:fatty acid desaturase family protein [Kitasatospora sp. NPDC001159]
MSFGCRRRSAAGENGCSICDASARPNTPRSPPPPRQRRRHGTPSTGARSPWSTSGRRVREDGGARGRIVRCASTRRSRRCCSAAAGCARTRGVPGKAAAFLAVHQALLGVYLGCVFAPNHKGMLMVIPEMRLDFLRRQVLTSRNVRGGLVVDAVMGGLNYQVEHHLFPSMPTPELGRAARITRAFCAEKGISYYEVGLFRSYREILAYLHRTGEPICSGE